MAEQGSDETGGYTTFSGRLSKPPQRLGFPDGNVVEGSKPREESVAPATSTPQPEPASNSQSRSGMEGSFAGKSFELRRSPASSIKSHSTLASSTARKAQLARQAELFNERMALQEEQRKIEYERAQLQLQEKQAHFQLKETKLKLSESRVSDQLQLQELHEKMADIEEEETRSQYLGSDSDSVHSEHARHEGKLSAAATVVERVTRNDQSVDISQGTDTLGHTLSTGKKNSVEVDSDEFQQDRKGGKEDRSQVSHVSHLGCLYGDKLKTAESVSQKGWTPPVKDSYVFQDPFERRKADQRVLGQENLATSGWGAALGKAQPLYPAGAVSTGESLFSGAPPHVALNLRPITDRVSDNEYHQGTNREDIQATIRKRAFDDHVSFPAGIGSVAAPLGSSWSSVPKNEDNVVHVKEKLVHTSNDKGLEMAHDNRSVPPGFKPQYFPRVGTAAYAHDQQVSQKPPGTVEFPSLLHPPRNRASERAKDLAMMEHKPPHVSINTIPNSTAMEPSAGTYWIGARREMDAAGQEAFESRKQIQQTTEKQRFNIPPGPTVGGASHTHIPLHTKPPPLHSHTHQNAYSTQEQLGQITTILGQLAGLQSNSQSASMKQARDSGSESEVRMLMARQTTLRELPTYSGEPEDWAQFKATFECTTQQCRFSTHENLARLQKCLKGPAKDAVRSLMISPANVDKIMLVLEEQFGQPRLIIHKLIEKARIVAAVKEERLESWMAFSGAVRSVVAAMSSLGCRSHLNNPMLLEELISKLPMLYRLEWAKHQVNFQHDPHLEDLESWLTVQTKLMTKMMLRPKPLESKPVKSSDQSKSSKKSTESLLAVSERESPQGSSTPPSTAEPKKANHKQCNYCEKEGHWALKCPQMKEDSVNTRNSTIHQKHLCWGCFSKQHRINDCKNKRKCGQDGCEKLHNKLLHRPSTSVPTSPVPKTETEQVAAVGDQRKRRVLLRITPVLIRGPQGEVTVFALFDEGSSCSLLEKSVADQLGIRGNKDPLKMSFANGLCTEDSQSERVQFEIADPKKNDFYKISRVRTITGLKLAAQTVDVPQVRKSWAHILDKGVSSYENVHPQLILGQDNYSLIAPRTIIEGPANAPVMTETRLGWIIHGNLTNVKKRADTEFVYAQVSEPGEDPLHELVQDYFAVEALGVKVTPARISPEDKRAVELLNSTTSRKGERFQTGLLWKDDHIQLPESYRMARQRLSSVEKRMDRDPKFASQYCAQMDHFFNQGYSKVADQPFIFSEGKFWVLPHFAVFSPRKPGKLRLVFDCAAKSNGVCLNDSLLTGPDYLTSLPGNLFAFRSRRVPLTGDIKEMFPQIEIIPSDQAAQCFLWRGMRRDIEPKLCLMIRMMFGAKSSPTSAQYVKNQNAAEHADQYPEAAEAIIKKHYADNYNDSFDSEEEALKMFRDVYALHQKGGFLMCNWNTSSKEVADQIPPDLRSKETTKWLLNQDLPNERILGLEWDPSTDTFKYDLSFYKVRPEILSQEEIPTKRDVSSVVMAVFDPLGLVSHISIHGRILLQEIWKEKIDWADQLPEKLVPKWGEFLGSLNVIRNIRIPRCYTTVKGPVLSRQVHIFSDASQKAFGSTAYLRTDFGDEIEVVLIMAKSRVVPLKPTTLTIPRLELEAAVLSTRLSKTILEGHDLIIDSVTFWTDSQIVLCWIRSEAYRHEVFVANRLGQIEENSKPKQWRYVPTQLNCADLLTKENSEVDSKYWYDGPEFLKLAAGDWPVLEIPLQITSETLELKKGESSYMVGPEHPPWHLSCRYSSHKKLVRVTARLLRARRWKKGQKFDSLSVQEMKRAQTKLELLSQRESYPDYVEGRIRPQDSHGKLFNLNPFKDEEGLLRVKGRISKSDDIDVAVKHPIILSGNHPYTQLLIRKLHEDAAHQGQETVLNNLRQNYWVPHARIAVKKAFRDCQACKNRKVKPLTQPMAALPSFRTERQSKPFAFTGIDYFGPMEITVGRRHQKRWGVMFTCLTIRAVHIEIAGTLSTDSCIMALRRFISRRGTPEKIWSDNGTNFKGAATELKLAIEAVDQQKLKDEAVSRGIEWEFIPPYSPHMGGCWERLIGSVKRALKVVLKEKAPHEETLHTLLVEAEAIVNQHPLTQVSLDSADDRALTPMDFLISNGLSNTISRPGFFDDDEFRLRRQWRISQRLADLFWKRWIHEYLPVLNRQGKWFGSARPVQVGDQVVIADDHAARNLWERAVVTQVYPGADNIIRVASVRTCTGNIYKRPVVKLCLLDLEKDGADTSAPGGSMSSRMAAEAAEKTTNDQIANRKEDICLALPEGSKTVERIAKDAAQNVTTNVLASQRKPGMRTRNRNKAVRRKHSSEKVNSQ